MVNSMSKGIITNLLNLADKVCHDYIYEGYNALADFILPKITLLFILVLVIYLWNILKGNIDTPLNELVNIAIKTAFSITAIKYWGFFSEHFALLFTNGGEEIANVLVRKVGSYNGQNLSEAMQFAFDRNMQVILEIKQGLSITNIWPLFIILFAFLLNIVTIGTAIGYLIVAKMGLAVLLSLAPLFIVFTWFKETKGITERAVAHLAGFAITPTFIYAALLLIMTFFNYGVDISSAAMKSHGFNFKTTVSFILTGIICLPVLRQMKDLAASITSGIAFCSQGAVQSMGNISLRPIKQLINKSK
tara:strand:+ start:2654 stop:3565 length:912 start_codon:yes stop_codon:yes gene_type:complete